MPHGFQNPEYAVEHQPRIPRRSTRSGLALGYQRFNDLPLLVRKRVSFHANDLNFLLHTRSYSNHFSDRVIGHFCRSYQARQSRLSVHLRGMVREASPYRVWRDQAERPDMPV